MLTFVAPAISAMLVYSESMVSSNPPILSTSFILVNFGLVFELLFEVVGGGQKPSQCQCRILPFIDKNVDKTCKPATCFLNLVVWSSSVLIIVIISHYVFFSFLSSYAVMS
jgi:hypothetical protein